MNTGNKKAGKVSFIIDDSTHEGNLDRCITSIRATIPEDEYELIITDCGLSDGITKAQRDNDLFVLSSNTVFPENAFKFLKEALYSCDNVGVVGGITNYTGDTNTEQGFYVDISDMEKAMELVSDINVPMERACEKKVFLSKFAMLIKRKAYEEIGGFDPQFEKGIYEDIDLCVRLNMAGYQVLMAYNSFIFNLGNGELTDDLTKEKNQILLRNKWECDLLYSSEARGELLEMMDRERSDCIEVLELGCALGSTLSRIEFLWPNSHVHGVEYDEAAARIAGSVNDVIQGDVENMIIPYKEGQFDYIICADVLEHLRDPQRTIERFLPYLKEDGQLIISVPNIRYYAVCMMLMQFGRFDYADSGILDRTHIHFFTKDTAEEMIRNCGLEILSTQKKTKVDEGGLTFISALKKCFEVVDAEEMQVFQYYFLTARKNSRKEHFDTLVVITPQDFARIESLYPRLCDNIDYGEIGFVGTEEVGRLLHENPSLSHRTKFINEDDIIPFNDVHACIKAKMADILGGRELPRGITGWYYQQFLKMQYAFICTDKYYMVWDGDTIPCKSVKMFQKESGKPYIDLKHEYHEDYFETMGKILPGFGKVIERSFISEHMLIRADIMRKLIEDIESNSSIPGKKFWEKIINAIPAEKIQNSAFSEFETYGTYVAMKFPTVYKLREWHSFRQAGTFYSIDTICERDFNWLAKDFDAISLEKGHTVREDNKNLFDNPYYQEHLTPKQMLQAAQQEYTDGYKEVWADDAYKAQANKSSGAFDQGAIRPDDRLKYLEPNEYKKYESLGDTLLESNANQAYLCYENAEYLCSDEGEKGRIGQKKKDLLTSQKVTVNKVAIVILSYNNLFFIQRCIESIYSNCNPDSYLLVIFDNGSKDGTSEWLAGWGESHDEAMVILNDENLGFSAGNNAACQYLPEGYDVFYLNNDTRMPANALFWLRMGLYHSDDVGAVGAVQNYAIADQLADVKFDVPEQYVEYGAKRNIIEENPYEEQSKICGFAMMITEEMFKRTGGFDEQFSPGFLEDDDLSLRIRQMGKKIILCQNAFIYHAGSQSFRKREDINEIYAANRKKLIAKWGFDSSLYAAMSENEYKFILELSEKGYTRDSKFSLLHIGCGCGNMLGHVKYLFPNAELAGIEENDIAREFAISCIPVYKDVQSLPMKMEEYDIVANNIG